MQLKQFNQVVDDQLKYCVEVLGIKGEEYVTGLDRLSHFKESGTEQDVSSKEALWGMLAKHLTSLKNMCKDGVYTGERWAEKLTDSINYLLLLRALVEEELGNEEN